MVTAKEDCENETAVHAQSTRHVAARMVSSRIRRAIVEQERKTAACGTTPIHMHMHMHATATTSAGEGRRLLLCTTTALGARARKEFQGEPSVYP